MDQNVHRPDRHGEPMVADICGPCFGGRKEPRQSSRRSYEREELIFDPLHYLALLERKTNALDQAAPLAGWELPEQFTCLRRLLEARQGTKERSCDRVSHPQPDGRAG